MHLILIVGALMLLLSNLALTTMGNVGTTFLAHEVLLKHCDIQPRVNSPQFMENVSTSLRLQLQIDRFIGIDDLTESLSFNGGLSVRWEVPCVAKLAQNAQTWPSNIDELVNQDPKDFWFPSLMHRNSLAQMHLAKEDGIFDNVLKIAPKMGLFTGGIIGKWVSSCDLTLIAFPFDTQTCEIVIGTKLKARYNEIANASLSATSSGIMPANTNWRLIGNKTRIERVFIEHLGEVTQAVFSLTLKRRPDFYLVNLFGPIFTLSLLELVGFFIPAEVPDRPMFACTILLSIFVLQDQLRLHVPNSPQPMIAAYYLFGVIVFAIVCATYSAGMCGFIALCPQVAHRSFQMTVCRRKTLTWPIYRIIDVCGFLLEAGVLFFFNASILFLAFTDFTVY